MDLGNTVSAEGLKNSILGIEKKKPKHMLLEIFRRHNDQIAALVGQEYSKGTLTKYETSYKHTQAFLLSKYNLTDIDINALNYEFITEYEFWLKTGQNAAIIPLLNTW